MSRTNRIKMYKNVCTTLPALYLGTRHIGTLYYHLRASQLHDCLTVGTTAKETLWLLHLTARALGPLFFGFFSKFQQV